MISAAPRCFLPPLNAITLCLTLSALAGQSAHGGVYDASADYLAGFNAGTNPNGVWSYGWSSSLTGPLNLYTQTATYPFSGNDAWIDPGNSAQGTPLVWQNENSYYENSGGGGINVPPGALTLSGGGIDNWADYSDVVFTSPNAGLYSLVSSFTGVQSAELASVNILDNGVSIFSGTVDYLQTQSFSATLNLVAGETITFAVGIEVPSGSNHNDNTQLQATFSSLTSVPEPSSVISLTVGGLICLGSYGRRRR